MQPFDHSSNNELNVKRWRGRFAPSPTGPLHLGHAYSAMIAARDAQSSGGQFLLRIEDIDQSRSRPHWEEQIYDDLAWLGLEYDEGPFYQTRRMGRKTGRSGAGILMDNPGID